MSMKILFMGTPDFASTCLQALFDAHMDVCAVVTKPDVPKGRGMKMMMSDVKIKALEKNIPVYQPEKLKNGELQEVLEKYQPDVIAVVAYGKILPDYVLNYPKYGCVNVHGSLLPKYRGAAPIQRAVLDGEAKTGITTMQMDAGLDTGDMLFVEEYPIGENQTMGEVFDALAILGGTLLVKTLTALEDGSVTPKKQIGEATYAEKIREEECLIDFHKNASDVHNTIRGLSPFPGAYAFVDGKRMKLYNSILADTAKAHDTAGKVLRADKHGVEIACEIGSVIVQNFKPEGKGMMTANDVVNGRKVTENTVFKKE